jgi:hypothetical protein
LDELILQQSIGATGTRSCGIAKGYVYRASRGS